MQKGFCPKQGKSLKNYAIFRFSCKPRGDCFICPKNLVILIGTNDIGIGLPPEYTLNNIKEILQRTQTLCPNTAVKSSIRA